MRAFSTCNDKQFKYVHKTRYGCLVMQILLGGEAPYIPRFMQINHQAIFEPSEAGFFQLVFDDCGSWKPPEAKNVVKKLAKNWFNFKAFNQ